MAYIKSKETNIVREYLNPIFCFLIVTFSVSAWSSGGDGGYEANAYAPEYYVPVSDIPSYAAGNIGVVPSSFWRIYQFLAYRAISGHPLSDNEIKLLHISEWRIEVGENESSRPGGSLVNGVQSWLAARQSIKNTPQTKVSAYSNAGDYGQYLNCPDSAFERASLTLADRIKTGGEENAKLWLEGQDAVFANCSPPTPWLKEKLENDSRIAVVVPPALPENAPAWLVYDREYQVAAAHFYAEKYDAARVNFLAISKNSKSPWQPLGAYLAARCLIRKAMLYYNVEDNINRDNPGFDATTLSKRKTKDDLLKIARTELLNSAKIYPPAKLLVSFVEAQLRPYEYMQELGELLATQKLDAATLQQLNDYLMLLDKMEGVQTRQANDAMTAWIGLMQAKLAGRRYSEVNPNERKSALDLARKHLKDSKNQLVWLAAVVTLADADELSAGERQAAKALPEGSAAYQTIQYHLANILISEKKLNEADEIVNKFLAKPKENVARATLNRWLRLKVITAKTEEEFLKSLPRTRAENTGIPIPDESGANNLQHVDFDTDYDQHLYTDFSLSELSKLLASKNSHAQYLKHDKGLQETMWTRAIVLGDFKTADNLTDVLVQGRETTRHLYERFTKAQTEEEKRLAAVLILVNTPELALFGKTGWASECHSNAYRACGRDPLNYLRADQVAAAKKEQAQLHKMELIQFISPILLNWVKQKPDDIEAPKALHFYIMSKRAETKNSKEAFVLLHKFYPKSEWAKKTKYFY